MDPITYLLATVDRIVYNLKATWDELTLHKWIRIVIIVGGYLLLRPYLMKLTGSEQMKQHENEEKEANKRAVLSPNDLRGGKAKVQIPTADADDVAEEVTGSEWGTKARKRQRQMLKKILSAEEQRLAEAQGDEDDKDIAEFLEE